MSAGTPAPGVPATVSWLQPRNPCLWLYVVLLAYGLYFTVTEVRSASVLYAPALGLSALIFAGYAVPFWWFTTRIDRYSRIPVSVAIAAFLFGGFAATWAIALRGNSAMTSLLGKVVSPGFAQDWGAALSAPIFEELGKGSGVLLILFIAPRIVRTAYDGFIVGAFVGLGFEIIEDTLYAINSASEGFGVDQIGSSLHTVALRLATGFTSHIAYAAIFGAGIIYLVGTRWQRRNVRRGVLLCALSMFLHGSWDATGVLSNGSNVAILLLLVGFVILAFVSVLIVFRLTVADERASLRESMTPEVLAGTLSEEELDALAGNRKDRKAYHRRMRDHHARKMRAHRLEAAHDLAQELAKSGGQESDRVAFARAELARLEVVSP